MPPKRAKVSPGKSSEGNPASIGALGLTVRPGEETFITNEKLGGILRVTTASGDARHQTPSNKILRDMGLPETGDDAANHVPPFWDDAEVLFEVVAANSDLLGGGARELPPDTMEALMTPNKKWSMKELNGMVPCIPGSESKQDTVSNYLGYRRSQWREMKIRRGSEVRGMAVDLHSGQLAQDCGDGRECVQVDEAIGSFGLGFVVDKSPPRAEVPIHSQDLVPFLKSIGTSGMVSLLQKIVRRRPQALSHPDTGETYPAEITIRQIVACMLDPSQPGIFLPDQGVHVSARQHLLKRMMTMMAEDSKYVTAVSVMLGGAALLTVKDPSWVPSEALCQQWEDIAVCLWNARKTSEYDSGKGLAERASSPTSCRSFVDEFASMVYEEIGGMEGDRGMLRWLRFHERNTVKTKHKSPCGIDSLDVYCDQHVEARFMWLVPPVVGMGPPAAPYGPALKEAFHAYSGHNVRRLPRQTDKDAHLVNLELAMKEASRMYRNIPLAFPESMEAYMYEYELPMGALAGLAGTLNVKDMLVSIDPSDLDRFVVIPRPSRSSSLKDLATDKKQVAVEEARSIFAKGHRDFVYDGQKWFYKGKPWDSYRRQVHRLHQEPQWDSIRSEFEGDLPWTCQTKFSDEVVLSAVGVMAGYEPLISFPHMNKSGAGTSEALTGLEGQTYQFLRHLALQFPFALWPSAKKPFAFETRCIALRLELRRRLIESRAISWNFPPITDTRKMRPLQDEALENMLKADAQNMGIFLWMLVGSGKSLTVLRYLDQTKRGANVLWALPSSAIASVAQEVRRVGWTYRILASTKGRLKHYQGHPTTCNPRELRSGIVTFVEHDDIRNLYLPLASQMMRTVFVFDEVHKAMDSKTQRTTYALKLARLAAQMVCLTGTPIVKSTAFTLMDWLRLCVPFKVDSRNFWVAANAMVAKLTGTPVSTTTQEVSVPLDPSTRSKIYQHLPQRLGCTASKPRWKEAYDASVEVVDEWLVKTTREVVYGPRGAAPKDDIRREDFPDDHTWAVAVTRKYPSSPEWFQCLPQRVLLVSANQSHSTYLINSLISAGTPAKDIMAVGGKKAPSDAVAHASSVCLSAEEYRQGVHMPKICVAPIQYCEGYTLTWMTCMISGVYPSNQAKRTQMEGRINRANCERLHRHYIIGMAGLTEIMYKHHRNAKNLETLLSNLSKM